MNKFTKDQLIARINQVTAINKYRISQDPDADGLAMDIELFAIARAALTAAPEVSDEEIYALAEKHEAVIVCSGEGDHNENTEAIIKFGRALLSRTATFAAAIQQEVK